MTPLMESKYDHLVSIDLHIDLSMEKLLAEVTETEFVKRK